MVDRGVGLGRTSLWGTCSPLNKACIYTEKPKSSVLIDEKVVVNKILTLAIFHFWYYEVYENCKHNPILLLIHPPYTKYMTKWKKKNT